MKGNVVPEILAASKTCSVPNCDNGGKLSRGWCATHYARWQRHGNVEAPDRRKRKRQVDLPCMMEDCDRIARKRDLCDMHYKRQWRTGSPLLAERANTKGSCGVEGCDQVVAYRGLCNAHYKRQRKYGDPLATAPPRAKPPKRPVKRYRRVYAPGHPLANQEGAVRENRYVLFNAIGQGPHRCHWCGTPVVWRTGAEAIKNLVVDHLDHDRLNNLAVNLVPSCNACNGHRRVGDVWDPWTSGTPIGRRSRQHALCRRGHALTEENIYVQPGNGQRQCLACLRVAKKRRYESRTPEQRAADLARSRQPIPCPICGEPKVRGSMRRHIRAMHDDGSDRSASYSAKVAGIPVDDLSQPPEPEGLW